MNKKLYKKRCREIFLFFTVTMLISMSTLFFPAVIAVRLASDCCKDLTIAILDGMPAVW